MRRLAPFAIALGLFAVTCGGISIYKENNMKQACEKAESLVYYNGDVRNSCRRALGWMLGETSIPVFGSSELSASDQVGYPRSLFKEGNSDFNMVLIGRGYMQSLHHAVTLGAMEDLLPDTNKKAVLILSPQWFTAGHLDSGTYASRFSERMYSRFIKNPRLSYETKKKAADRLKILLKEDPRQLERIEKYENLYVKKRLNPITWLEMNLYDSFMDFRQEYVFGREVKSRPAVRDEGRVKAEEIDFGLLMEKAGQAGKEACTNNRFLIYDEYYDTYVRAAEEERRGSDTGGSYQVSPEYEDLRLFLDVCKETGTEPLIVSIPVNGRWYDWTGFPKEDREAYYENIRKICEEYQVEMADFSDKEYEEYFLKDIMHLGWKGWVYLDEAVYEFWKE